MCCIREDYSSDRERGEVVIEDEREEESRK
jgi:hypothetical protein